MNASPAPRPVARLETGAPVVVIGAGVVGLSAATMMARAGLEVTVVDRVGVAAGSSWGNAGFITPALATPLPKPAMLRTGVRALISPRSPVYVPPRFDLHLWRFLIGFARHCTTQQWRDSVAKLAPLLNDSLAAFDEIVGETDAADFTLRRQQILAVCRHEADLDHVLDDLNQVRRSGVSVAAQRIDAAGLAQMLPHVASGMAGAVRIDGQRIIDPPRFMQALASTAQSAGVDVQAPVGVASLNDDGRQVTMRCDDGRSLTAAAVVIATGAELGMLARPFGVRRLVQAGRGYSFSITPPEPVDIPTYFPSDKIVATPLADGKLRIAGMMEFRRHGSPIDQRRIEAIADAARRVLPTFDLDDRADAWVGSRPVTVDGNPLIGPTRSPRVIAAGGHGMWGVVLGPLTGKIVMRMFVDGQVPAAVTPFDALR